MPGFDFQRHYAALAARFAKLAREPGSWTGNFAKSWPTSAASPKAEGMDEQALRLYRRQLHDAFMFASDRGQVEVAVCLLQADIPAENLQAILATGKAHAALPLLKQGIAAKNLEAILASMPGSGAASHTGLAKRIADYRATITDLPASGVNPKSGEQAAAILASYYKAIGRPPSPNQLLGGSFQ